MVYSDIEIDQLVVRHNAVIRKISDNVGIYVAVFYSKWSAIEHEATVSVREDQIVKLCNIQNADYLRYDEPDIDYLIRGDFEINVLERVIEILAKESPDAVYDHPTGDCYYSEPECGKGKGCLIGQALQVMGVNVRDIDLQTITRFRNLRLPDGWTIDDQSTIDRIQAIQDRQDGKTPWGKCIKKGEPCSKS